MKLLDITPITNEKSEPPASLVERLIMTCIHCGEELPKRRKKYCSDRCAYWFKQIQNEKIRKFSVTQHLRMQRAGRAQRMGKIGVRFN